MKTIEQENEQIITDQPKTKNMPHEIKLPKKCPHCNELISQLDIEIGVCYECNERI